MSRSKKGFTIVELVIVIAVIAILAAVLIPSFSSLNKKAKDSAYLQERTNQQIADLAEKVENQKFLSWEDLEAKLAEELAKIPAGVTGEELDKAVTDATTTAFAKFENSLKTDDTALTEAQVKAIIEKALEGQLTTAQVEGIVTAAVKDIEITTNTTITEAQVKAIIDNAVAGLNKQTGITKEEMETAISNALAAQDPTLTGDTVKGIINDALAGFGYGNDLSASQIENIINNAMAASKDKADVLAAEEMNAVIDAAGAADFDAAIKALTAAGYNVSALTPIRSNYIFTWNGNAIVCELDSDTNKDIVEEGAGLVVADVKDATSLKKAIANGNAVTLEADIAYNEQSLTIASGNVTIDLNGHTLTLPEFNDGRVDRHKYVEVNADATLTLIGGTIEARGVQAYKDGELIIKGTKVVALDADGGAAVYAWAGSKITVEGGEFIASEQAECVINAGGEVVIKDGTFTHTLANTELRPYAIETNAGGNTTIEKATVAGARGVFACKGDGSITTINGGTYKTDGLNGGWCVYTDRDSNPSSTAKVVINGGTFVGTQMFFGNYEDKR